MADLKISALTAITPPLAGTEPLPIVQSSTTKKVTVAQLQAAPIAAQNANCLLYTNGSKVPTTNTLLGYDGVAKVSLNGNAVPAVFEISSSGISGESARITNNPAGGAGLKLSSDYFAIELAPGGLGSADVKVTAANIIPGTAGKGINFTANTPAAGMTSQLLNWYEEGTFVATLTPNTSGTITLSSNNTLSYTRMGRVVVVNGLIDVASVSLPVGTYVLITTLPFTPATISPNAGRSGGAFGVLSTTAGNITPGLLINSGNATTYIAMNASTVQTGTSFYVQFTYITA